MTVVTITSDFYYTFNNIHVARAHTHSLSKKIMSVNYRYTVHDLVL